MAQFTIDPEDLIKQRIANRLAIAEGLPETGTNLEMRNPTVTAMPNATAEAQGIASPEQVQYTMNNLQQRFNPTQGETAPAPSAEQIGQQVANNPEAALIQMGLHPVVAKEIAKNMNDTNPPKLIGSDILGTGRGGIMGLGIEPIDVLAFAFGAAITGNLPQSEAINATLQIAGLPRRYKDAQRRAGGEVISQLLAAGGLAKDQASIAASKANAEEKTLERQALINWTDLVAANAAKGIPFTPGQRLQMMALGARAKIPAEVMKATLEKPLSDIIAEAEIAKRLLGGKDANIQTTITTPGGAKLVDKPDTRGESDLTQGVRQELAIARAKGENISLEEAANRATNRQAAAAGQKAGAVAQSTPLSAEATSDINMGQDIQRQLKIMKDNIDEGVKLLGKKHLSTTYTETILPMTKMSEGQQKFLQAFLRLRQLDKVPITGAAAAVQELKSLFATLPQLFANEKNFRTTLDKSIGDTNGWVQRYGSMVTQPKSETGKQFRRPEGARKVED